MANDPVMTGYVPLIATAAGVFQAKDYPERIRGISAGKTEQEVSLYPQVPLNFGTIANGETSQAFNILIVNRGYKAVTLDSVEVVGDFTIGAITEMTLQPEGVLSVPVFFKPKRTGGATGAIYVTAGNATGERFLKLIGNAS